ncbi:phospholipase D-like domain-containing protein [Protaetiibacter intestinalis]|nr:phospholipase D-like domain-containing protein [Protaetiibacter intestinalis]
MSTGKLLARDVYPGWKRMAASATESIRVFTPYLDSLLARLLANAVISTPQISVVTDLSPNSGALTYRRQLLGLRQLLTAGVEVRSLPRLHAKVMVVDGKRLTVGSQNFTSYARGSRETTASFASAGSERDFLAELDRWFAESTMVDLALVEALLDGLKAELEAERDAHALVVARYEELLEEHQDRQRRLAIGVRNPSFTARLERAAATAQKRMAQASLRAWVDWTDGYYKALVVDEYADLTRWSINEADGSVGQVRLTKLYMHPVLLAPSGRMGFARLAMTRSTYVRFSVDMGAFTVGGLRFNVSVRLPKKPDEANMEIVLRPAAEYATGGLTLRLAFDGAAFEVVSCQPVDANPIRYRDNYWLDWKAVDVDELVAAVTDPANVASLTSFALQPFRYKELGTHDKNAAEFFPAHCTLTLVQVGERRVLIARAR